jgi:hypothetical protein
MDLHDQWGPNGGSRFIVVGRGFPILLICSRVFLVLRWMMLEKVLGILLLDAVLTWPLSLPMRRVVWMGLLIPCATIR